MDAAPVIYSSEKIGSMSSKGGEPFDIRIGLSRELVEQLKKFSLDTGDTDLQENTSDYRRFGEGSYEEWYAKERTPYALINGEGKLAALTWFGPKPLGRKSLRFLSPEELAKESSQEKTQWHTIVYRSYRPYRGAGLMTKFVAATMEDYLQRNPGAKLWAGISLKNPASIALATKLGFVQKDEYVDTRAQWCAMVRE